ncbi:MAG: DUF45 domain-containing protein, partial [Anaerolineae bacterium]|nr:DUF45 domain-containing protein [Anaerolineae bacterium]
MLLIDKIIRSNRKTIALVVELDGKLIIRAPKGATKRQINSLIEKHEAWIIKKQAEARKNAEAFAPHDFIEGEEFFFLGKKYALHYVEKFEEVLKQDIILDGDFKIKNATREKAEQFFEKWYKKEARKNFKERIEFYAKEHGFEYAKIKLSSAKRRWG